MTFPILNLSKNKQNWKSRKKFLDDKKKKKAFRDNKKASRQKRYG